MSHGDDASVSLTRRGFVRGATLAGAGLAAAGALGVGSSRQAHAADAPAALELAEGDVVLFQGDSITDAGRNRDSQGNANDLAALGYGYPMMASTNLLGEYASLKLACYNRGISGHKVPDLANRWDADCIDLNPRVVSILIGINDLWHHLQEDHDAIGQQYEEGYTALVARTQAALPNSTVVICEPFILRCGHVNEGWSPGVENIREAARRVCDGAGAVWVPFQTMFDDAISESTPPEYWAGDGVHPTTAGHALMAATWLKSTGLG